MKGKAILICFLSILAVSLTVTAVCAEESWKEKGQKEEAEARQIAEEKRKREEADRLATDEEKKRKESEKAKETITNSIGQTFVYIEPGTFIMGSPSSESGRDDDERQHRVTLTKGFYMQSTEVTQGQWKAVMESNPSSFKNCGDDCPVEDVSWNNCQEFIRKLNMKEGKGKYRLPTEAEWEYACRAGTTGPYAGTLDQMGWYDSNSVRKTHPVGQKQPNVWGLYDMHGNVWEWCQDSCAYKSGGGVITDTYRDGMVDPISTNGSYRVNRGGSWHLYAEICRSANRGNCKPGRRFFLLGFRLLRTE